MTPDEARARAALKIQADEAVQALVAAGDYERLEDLVADLARMALSSLPPALWPVLLAEVRKDLAAAGLRLRLGEDRN